jgi:predicted aspartyl protease
MAIVKVVEVVDEEEAKDNFLVASVPSTNEHVVASDLLERVSVVVRPTRVSVEVGRVNVAAPLVIEEITGEEEKVFTPVMVWVVAKVITVSAPVIFGTFRVWLVVCWEEIVKVLAVVLLTTEKMICLVVSLPSTKAQELVVRDLLAKVSVVERPTSVSVEDGRVRVAAPLVIEEMTGAEEKVLTPVMVWAKPKVIKVSPAIILGTFKV